MTYISKLKTWKKKTIEKNELEKLFSTGNHSDLYKIVKDLESDGFLVPVKSVGTDGNLVYPIFLKYRISIEEDHSESLKEIEYLHPSIKASGILQKKSALYEKYKKEFEILSTYLFKSPAAVSISKKEKSFELFGEEKFLDETEFRSLLDRMGLTSERLGYYETPEYCFNDFIPERKKTMVLLICENKDIWFNIRRRMYEDDASSIFGVHIDGVVYGCGNKVSEKNALTSYSSFMRADNITYLYWGDIDRAGLNIYLSLVKNNPELTINLFVPAYEKMLQLASQIDIPDSLDNRGIMGDYLSIEALFTGDDYLQLSQVIVENKRIPQEIINYKTLLEDMR